MVVFIFLCCFLFEAAVRKGLFQNKKKEKKTHLLRVRVGIAQRVHRHPRAEQVHRQLSLCSFVNKENKKKNKNRTRTEANDTAHQQNTTGKHTASLATLRSMRAR